MRNSFTKRIKPFVEDELLKAGKARMNHDIEQEFHYLERAHVIGQESTYWHVKVHLLMLIWGIRNNAPKEIIGQTIRVIGAITKTALGLVPKGNTGGANVNPFKTMPIPKDLQLLIRKAKFNCRLFH